MQHPSVRSSRCKNINRCYRPEDDEQSESWEIPRVPAPQTDPRSALLGLFGSGSSGGSGSNSRCSTSSTRATTSAVSTTLATASTTTTALTTEASTSAISPTLTAATSSAAMEAALAIAAATVTLHGLEPVALCLGSSGGDLGGRLGVVVGPGLGVAWRGRGGGQAGLGLRGVAGDVHPLLGLGEVVGVLGLIPLALAGGVGCAVGYISCAVDDGGLLLGVAVGEGLGGTFVNLRQTGVGDSRVRCRGILVLPAGLGSFSFRLLEEESVSGSGSLDLSICGWSI